MVYENQNILDLINAFKNYCNEDFTFLPVAVESEIEYFENKFKVKLPQEYRWFLLNVANGIISKSQWGFSLINPVDFKNYCFQEFEFNPSIPFELTTKVKFSEPDKTDTYPYEIIYDKNDEIFSKGYLNGEIDLVGYGCGTVAFLVINGQEYGNVWIDDYSSNSEVHPEYDLKNNKKRLNFSDWISKEISRKIEQLAQSIEYHKRKDIESSQATTMANHDNPIHSNNHQKSFSIISFIKNLFN